MDYLSIENIVYITIKNKFDKKINEIEIENFTKVTVNIINKEFSKLKFLQLDKEDFLYIVFLAIDEVESKFEPKNNVPLLAYATFIIKRRILDYARFLRRNKRKITLQIINAYRGNIHNQQRTVLEKDIEDYSYQEFKEIDENYKIREIIGLYLETNATDLEKLIIKMLYLGYSQKTIMKVLNITRYEIIKCKENLKKYFISFIK